MRLVFTALGLLGLIVLERRFALRREVQPKLRRDARNLAIASLAGLTVQLLESPVAERLAMQTVRSRRGLVAWLPAGLRSCAAILLLDYTLYLWHVLTHRVPVLWRFHRVHHIDLDLDASTALRFHFGEMALSVPFRALQILLIGPSPRDLRIWQTLLFSSILFHHSNLRLPSTADRFLAHFVVTPRLHGIHHSVVEQHVNSNWSSGLTIWDRLHGTLVTDAPQDAITIGVKGFLEPDQVALGRMLALPFETDSVGLPPPLSSGNYRRVLRVSHTNACFILGG